MSEEQRRRWPRVLAGVLSVAVLVATGLSYVTVYFAKQLAGNILADSSNLSTDSTAPKPGAPINILLMGSDARTGANAKLHFGNSKDIKGARSDTTILLHISADRKSAFGVSIPRDLKVKLPTCQQADGTTYEGGAEDRINKAFDIGGPGCTVKAVEELSGANIDHFMVVDFSGFKNVVDALGGVEVCLTKPVDDPNSKLKLPAGKSVVKGDQALAFVRARETLGDGSDIGRIQRQQDFLSSAIRKATSAGVLTNPAKLYSVLSAGTKSLRVDPGLASFDALKDLAVNSSSISPGDIVFATVPWDDSGDGETVVEVPSKAKQLWNAIKNDQTWPPKPTVGSDGKELTASPGSFGIKVVNATGTSGNGQRAADQLTAEGYEVDAITSKDQPTVSKIRYNPNSESDTAAAMTLQAATGAALAPDANVQIVTLIVGTDYAFTVNAVNTTKAKSESAGNAKPRTAAESICSG